MNGSPTTAGSQTPDGGALDRATLVVAGVVILSAVMSILDATVVNVALDTLVRELDSTLPTIQWVISGYTLALASVIPISGWAADRFGARRVWLVAVALFTCSSILCALAWSAGALIAFRVLQGIGGGLLTPVGTAIIARAAGPRRMGRVMSLMGVPLLLGPVLGPVLGGVLLQTASWHWIFLINVPVGALAVALGWRLLPRTPGRPADRLDFVGLLLLSPGLAALIFGVSQVRTPSSLGSPPVVISVTAGVALIGAFVWRSLGTDSPLLDLRLFTGRTFSAAAITVFALGTATFGSMLLLPLYFQQVRGESVFITGLLTTPQALGMAVAMTLSGRLSDKVGAGWVVPVGIVIAICGQLGLTTLTATTPYWAVGAVLVLLGLGLGASMMPAMSAAYATLGSEAVSRATSELQIAQRVGSTFGSALFAVVLAQRIAAAGASGGGAGAGGVTRLAEAYSGTFWWAVALGVVALIPALALPRRHRAPRQTVLGHHHPMSGNGVPQPEGGRWGRKTHP